MSEHTPGPWTVHNNGYGGTVVYGPKGVIYNLEEADASLIAATLDMLEALKAAEKWLLLPENLDLPGSDALHRIIEEAIAKAEGES